MRVLVCGSREWEDPDLLGAVLHGIDWNWSTGRKPGISVLIHGGARGADTLAHEWADDFVADGTTQVEVYLADWDKHGKAAGILRNQQMLEEGKPDLVVAFMKHGALNKGTKDMVYRARSYGVKTVVVEA